MIPPSERSQDSERSAHDLVNQTARPLTDEEKKAADRDTPVGERVYAPASERVPRDPVPGHRDFVDRTDTSTTERQSATSTVTPTMTETPSEPTFTRVPRPGTTPPSYMAAEAPAEERWMSPSPAMFPIGVGWAIACGVGVWLFMRWRRERNKPMNRLRRQALQARRTAYELRDRMPDIPEEATRPAMGLGTVLLSIAVFLWQQSQTRSRAQAVSHRMGKVSRRMDKSSKHARKAMEDAEWQERLMQLRDRWNPSWLELDKVSLPKR